MRSLSTFFLALGLFGASCALEAGQPADPAAKLLATQGFLRISNASLPHRDGYVEAGNRTGWIVDLLGKPTAVLPDHSWVYRNYHVLQSAAVGTLIIRFHEGRVNELLLVSKPSDVVVREALGGKVYASLATAPGGTRP